MPEFISTPTSMDGLSYHDFASRPYDHFHGPPPATDVMVPALFSTHHGFSFTPYPTTPLGMGPGLHDSRPLSEPFSLFPRGSFGGPDTSPSSSGAPTTPTAVTPPYAGKKTDRIVKPNDINPKAKAKRTSYACEQCRRRKQKCDGAKPCHTCKEQELDCRYRQITSSKKDAMIEKLTTALEANNKTLLSLNDKYEALMSTIRLIQQRLIKCWRCGSAVESDTGKCDSCEHLSSEALNARSLL